MRDLVVETLSSSGPIARALGEAFEGRAEQLRMAEAVLQALNDRGTLLAEAGTGVGKSFAYLVPTVLRCVLLGEKVVISTHTIALQEQLIEKDIPLLQSVVEPFLREKLGQRHAGRELYPLKPVLVKGRGNYLSIRRLKLAGDRAGMLLPDADARLQLEQIMQWAYETTDGTLATLPPMTRPEVWTHVESDTDNCMGRKCEHYDACFFQNARREAETANLLICNHALFFADMQLRIMTSGDSEENLSASGSGGQPGSPPSPVFGILPPHHHVILDEAHTIEDVASDHLGISLTEGRIHHLLRSLFEPRRRKGFLAQLASTPLATREPEAIDRAINRTLEAGDATRLFFERWERLVEEGRAPGGRVMGPGAVENILTPAMTDLALRLKGLREMVRSEQDKFELNAYSRRAEGIAILARHFVEQALPESVYWVELGATRRGKRRLELACAPIDVAPLLREHLFASGRSVVLTSATLATRTIKPDEPAERAETAFMHITQRLGCEDAKTLQLGSPFDYARQASVFVETGIADARQAKGRYGSSSRSPSLPPPHLDDSDPTFAPGLMAHDDGAMPRTYEQQLADAVLRHLDATDGGAFVLFTSFSTLARVADELERPLQSRGMPLLRQVEGSPRGQLLKEFKQNRRSVLLGAASFWQGVDVRGDGLRCVIMTKLPFDPPDRPLTQARLDRIQARGGNPFMEESLPRAVIKFKQGFGRLIRSRTDTGRVVILDSRIVTARYGRVFLEALPPGIPISRVSPNDLD